MLYLLHEAPEEEQTMEMILTMIEYGGAKEGRRRLSVRPGPAVRGAGEEQPDHIAVREYHIFKQAAGKTAPLHPGERRCAPCPCLPSGMSKNITARDTLELEKLGDRKQAIFCVIPDSNDNSLNFLVGMLYTQTFQELYYQADKVHGGSLPVPVRLMFDEFANLALPMATPVCRLPCAPETSWRPLSCKTSPS